MTEETWWKFPPKNSTAGGYLTFKESETLHYISPNQEEIYDSNKVYYAGFRCEKQNAFPADLLSDAYECFSHHTYIKFPVPTTASGTVTDANLYLYLARVDIETGIPSVHTLQVYYKQVYDITQFPWDSLDTSDYPAGGWYANPSSWSENFDDLELDFLAEGAHWLDGLDVTDAVNHAIDEGWEWIAFLITYTPTEPIGWDYDHRVTDYDQKARIEFYGATQFGLVPPPQEYADDWGATLCLPCPWLRITYSGAEPPSQYYPGEDATTSGEGAAINCIAADPRTQTAIVGANTGSLWVTTSGGADWTKIYEQSEPVTAVWMDYIRNQRDYPSSSMAWFGTASGSLYISEDSLESWTEIYNFGSEIVEIMSSDEASWMLVVGTVDGVWTSPDAGYHFGLAQGAPEN